MKKICLLFICLWGLSAFAVSSTLPATIVNALDISVKDQLSLADFKTTTYQFAYGKNAGGFLDWSERAISPAAWPEYDGKTPAYGPGHLNFDRTTGEASGTVPFLTPITFVDGKVVYNGKCLMTPVYDLNHNAAYMTAHSLSFKIKGAGILTFLAKLSLDPINEVDLGELFLPPGHLLHLFNSEACRMIVLLDGEEVQPTLESFFGYLETGFTEDNIADEETLKTPIESGHDWGLYSLDVDTGRYNHTVEILVLLPGKNYSTDVYKDLTTNVGVRAEYGTPADPWEKDTDFSPCYYRVWFDDFRWTSEEEENDTSLPLVVITPDAAADGGVSQNIADESHYTYTFTDAGNRIFLDSSYDNIVFMYTLDGSEPIVDADGSRADNTFLYDDVQWDLRGETADTRYILRATDEAGVEITATCILKVKAYEKTGESTYIPTDGLIYPKKNLVGADTVYHYIPRVPKPELQFSTTLMRPGGTVQITSPAPASVTFYYTIDGSPPTWLSNGTPAGTTIRIEAEDLGAVRQANLSIAAACTLNCIAVKSGWADSELANLVLLQATAPVIDLPQQKIFCQAGETIYYQSENGQAREISSGALLPEKSGYFLCQTTGPGKLNSVCVTVMNFPALQQGWNLLALPGELLRELVIPPETIAGVFAYDAARKTYYRTTTFTPGEPFWVFALADTAEQPLVISAPMEKLTLAPKWNFGGGIRNTTVPTEITTSQWTNGRFQSCTAMTAWQGYWLFAPQATTINSDYAFE